MRPFESWAWADAFLFSRALLLLVLVESALGANVTQSRTYFSDVFRLRDGTKASASDLDFFSLSDTFCLGHVRGVCEQQGERAAGGAWCDLSRSRSPRSEQCRLLAAH